ncbi:CaiB/BaiF CoA transferase family protein [Actinomadura syzygii]|uniref:CoA transferase n=1 Tax=Actinomadura syzygii TaxID=1427538 RepID=A0A5D0TZL4_9ACTN|nr:CoA transferase [Actinomadura syzygii]TYC11214.1 CoA transferase [Actinomadura syzygii]
MPDRCAGHIRLLRRLHGSPLARLATWIYHGQGSYRGHRLWWTVHARNKRCVTLDLRSPEGRDLLLQVVKSADVVIENFRPGTLERWNLGYDRLSEHNPGLVLARISGYGQTGPYRERPGYASAAEAMGGLRAINGHPGEAPPRMGISLGDSLAGMFAVQGILAALLGRGETGAGQVVDVALTEACLALTESVIGEYDRLGRVRRPSGTRLEGIAPSNIFRTADDRWLIVAANQDSVFRRLCAAMDMPKLADDQRFTDHRARGRHQDEIDEIVGQWVAEHTAEHATAALLRANVVVAPVHTAADIVADPQFSAPGQRPTMRELWVSTTTPLYNP